jgi:ketosteroid isomerase-like protein
MVKRYFVISLSVVTLLLTGCFNQQRMTNTDIVKSTYEGKTSEENAGNLAAHLAPDARWTEAAGFPYAGTYIGMDAIAQHVFHRLATEWIDYKITIEDYVADGDRVVAYGTYSGTYKTTGKFMKARVAHLWKLKGGKILSFEQFVDSKTVTDAMQ